MNKRNLGISEVAACRVGHRAVHLAPQYVRIASLCKYDDPMHSLYSKLLSRLSYSICRLAVNCCLKLSSLQKMSKSKRFFFHSTFDRVIFVNACQIKSKCAVLFIVMRCVSILSLSKVACRVTSYNIRRIAAFMYSHSPCAVY